MNENLVRKELLIQFENNVGGSVKTRTKTFKNIRFDANQSNLATFSQHYVALVDQTHIKSLVADYIQISE